VEKIHARQNDCMLFNNEDVMLEECRVCETSQYKQNDKNIDDTVFPHNPSCMMVVHKQSKC
jgi:hypothetical protein